MRDNKNPLFLFKRGGENLYISKDDPNRNYFLYHCKNIVKTKDGYVLQTVYREVDDNHIDETKENKTNPTQNERIKNCSLCIHNSGDNCVIRTCLEKLPPNHFIPYWWNNKCDAYEPLQELTVINSIEEMINFVEKSENFFGSPEEYEEYYGFQRNWNEETGEILESVREYYNRGGRFTELPEQYPCVVYFSYCDTDNMSHEQDGLKWIYIGN